VSSRHNALVTRARQLARADSRASQAVLEGVTLIRDASDAGWPLEVVAVTERALQTAGVHELFEALPADTDRVVVTPAVMDAISPARTPSGAVALARIPPRSIGDILARRDGLVVGAVGVQDPGNLGAIVRVAEAFAASGVLACGRTAAPFGWKVLRGAMGSAFRLPLVGGVAPHEAIAAARDNRWQVVAATLHGRGPERVDFAQPTLLLVGSEGSGLPAETVDAADLQISVPMQPPVESLNVAVATGILLYEARRQRTTSG
jgi:TrmH family RNA methyltransferase